MSLNDFFYSFNLFFLIFIRVTGLFVTAPFFGSRTIPFKLKMPLAFFTAVCSFPVIKASGIYLSFDEPLYFFSEVFINFIIGMVMGFFVYFLVVAFQLAGQFFSIQMGFGIVNVFDPQSESSVPIIGQLQGLFATLVFLVIGGHRLLVVGVVKSFEFINSIKLASFLKTSSEIVSFISRVFEIAFLIGSPVIGTLFLMSVVLGILSKVAPQMNVMMLGFPLKIGVGLLIVCFLVPVLFDMVVSVSEEIFDRMYLILRVWGKV